ncbi:hypothetical protein BGZ96_004352, partial [Linnemannia gamsii]
MMLALKVSNANQARDMLSVRNCLAQVNDKMSQQSNQSQWANNMMASLARTLVRQEKHLLLQQAQIQALQQAIELVGRHPRYPGSLLPSNPSFPGFSYTGVPGPGYLPPPASSSSSQPFTQKEKQKQKNIKTQIAIQPLRPHPKLRDPVVSARTPPATSASSLSHASELEFLLGTQPKKTSLASPLEIPGSEADTEEDGSPSSSTPAPAPARVDWFDATRDHSTSRSVYEEYRKYNRELQEKLNTISANTNKRRRKQDERQS